jgi:hypothetical protein
VIGFVQSVVCDGASRVFGLLERIARRKVLVCFLMAVLPMSIRWLALRSHPIPEPLWDDEYSYLLGADTLASGRVANPPHPMWVHFETFHVNWLPTYVTKFPPGQPLVLAFGQKFLGHPWYGVWISFGLMSAALCWVLQGWAPPVWAMLGALMGIAQIGILRYWMDSYCGGAVPAMGGCLVLGAAIRLARGANWRAAALGALGLMMLANSRPIEGVVTSLAATVFLLLRLRRTRVGWRGLLQARPLMPAALVIILGFCWMGFYNYRTTGSPIVFSYAINHKTYGANPQFWFLSDWPPPVYRHEAIRKLWVVWTRDYWVRARHNPLVVVPAFLRAISFFYLPLLGFAGIAGLLLARSIKVWAAVAIFAVLCGFLLLEVDVSPHYFSPAIFLTLMPVLYAVRWMRVAGRRFGPALVLLFTAMIGLKAVRADLYHEPFVSSRAQVARSLTARGGRHLVFVRYAPEHEIVMIDLVYNRADIDHSQIVWARYMGEAEDQELIRYYPDRTTWILDADSTPMSLHGYSSGTP